MKTIKTENTDKLLITLLFFISGLIITGIAVSGLRESFYGFLSLQVHKARLISDFIEIAGIGGAFLNAGIVGLTGIILIRAAGIPFSGPTYAAIMTMTGFGLFGKTPLNILPIVLGVFISARFVNKRFRDYLIIALFGTALGPLVSTIAWELGFPLIPALISAAAGGIAIGFILPAAAISMLHLHQGYNLYNMGLTCGFLSLFAAALIKGMGHSYTSNLFWYSDSSIVLTLLVPALSLFLIYFSYSKRRIKKL